MIFAKNEETNSKLFDKKDAWSGTDTVKRFSNVLFSLSFANFLIFFIIFVAIGGFEWKIGHWKISCRSLSGPAWISLYICIAGVLVSHKYFSRKAQNFCMTFLELSEKRKQLYGIILCFLGVLVLCLVSLPRHFQLRSNAYDLGIHADILRNITAGKGFFDPVHRYNYLGDHFSPALILAAPLLFLWKSSGVLLVFQAFLFSAAALAVFKISAKKLNSPVFSFLFLLLFIFSPYVQRINNFDYHPVVISIPLVLWGLYFLEEKKTIIFFTLITIAFFTKESLPLSAFGLSLFLVLDKEKRKTGFYLMGLSLVFFMVVNIWVIPHFQNPELKGKMLGYYWKTRYSNLGSSPIDMFYKFADDPSSWLSKNLFVGKKIKALFRLLGFTCFVILFSGKRIIPLLIPIAWCTLSGYKHQWSFGLQYSSELIPYYFYAAIFGLRNLLRILKKNPGVSVLRAEAWAFIGMVFLLAASFISFPQYFRIGSFEKAGYIQELVKQIPDEKRVITQNSIHPHIPIRNVSILMSDSVWRYSLNNPIEADYLLVDPKASDYWPFKSASVQADIISKVIDMGNFGLLERKKTLFLFKKDYPKRRNSELFRLLE